LRAARVTSTTVVNTGVEDDATRTGSSFIGHDVRLSRDGGDWRASIRAKADFLQHQLSRHSNGKPATTSRPSASPRPSRDTSCDDNWNAAHPTKARPPSWPLAEPGRGVVDVEFLVHNAVLEGLTVQVHLADLDR
jgi:hypothetical protein